MASQLGQIVNTFHEQVVRHRGTSVSQSRLVQGVSLLKDGTDEYLKQVELSSASRDVGFQEKIAKVLSLSDGPAHESTVDDGLSSIVQRPHRASGLFRPDLWRVFSSPADSILPPIQDLGSTAPYPLHDTSIEVIHYATTPFTQQLFRACAESGYGYLINSSVSDAQMWHEFGLQLEYQPREDIIRYFKRALQMNPCNPIKNCQVPFISLGGAGTHFQTTNAGSASMPQPREVPSLLLFQETNGVRVVPSEEQWLDVRDVEGYLVENGVMFGCHSSVLNKTGRAASSSLSDQVVPKKMAPVLDESALIQGVSWLFILHCVRFTNNSSAESDLHLSGMFCWLSTP